MPFRRRSKLLDELAERLKVQRTPLSSMHLLGVIELVVERVWVLVKWVALVSVILFVLSIGLELQIQRRNQVLDEIHRTAEESRQLLEQVVDPAAPNSPAALDAIERIKRIEAQLCGGPCPPAPGENK